MAVFHCPACNYLKTVDDKHLGRSADCPKCKARGTICDPRLLISQTPTQESLESPSMGSAAAIPTLRPRQSSEQIGPGKTMGKCRLCGEVTFDLGDHHARKHPHSVAHGSVAHTTEMAEVQREPKQPTVTNNTGVSGADAASVPAWYVRAQNVNEGMHRFHKYSKLTSFACIGFGLWANDLADNWVGFLCNQVDKATQSTLWSWTAGWVSPPPPAISPMYRTYNFIMTLVAIACTVWASRWYFHTMLMTKARASASSVPTPSLDDHLTAIKTDTQRLFGWWQGEYIATGVVANLFFRGVCPFAIPWYPSFTSWILILLAIGTVVFLSAFVETQEAESQRTAVATADAVERPQS